jgi:uncharacterized membrane protein YagU involved in acid resistance
MNFDRSKIIAIITGIFSLLLGVLYLVLVQLLDLRGEMLPAPVGVLSHTLLHGLLLPAMGVFRYS